MGRFSKALSKALSCPKCKSHLIGDATVTTGVSFHAVQLQQVVKHKLCMQCGAGFATASQHEQNEKNVDFFQSQILATSLIGESLTGTIQ